MTIRVSLHMADRPTWMAAIKGTNLRSTFRSAVANRLRPRMNYLVEELKRVTIYPKIAGTFHVRQRTTDRGMEFEIVSRGRGEQLETPGGTPAHTIVQEPHLIPRGQLENWLEGGGSWGSVPDNIPRVAAHVQIVLNRREIVIPHPGTAADEPVEDAIFNASHMLYNVSNDAAQYWADRFGVTGEESQYEDGED